MANRVTVPFFSDFHAPFVRAALAGAGLSSVEIRSGLSQDALLAGLSYANNDDCYSAIVAAGQVTSASACGALCAVPRVCADCRAADAPGIVKRALHLAGQDNCVVVPLGDFLCARGPYALDARVARRLAAAVVFGDIVLQAHMAAWSEPDIAAGECATENLPLVRCANRESSSAEDAASPSNTMGVASQSGAGDVRSSETAELAGGGFAMLRQGALCALETSSPDDLGCFVEPLCETADALIDGASPRPLIALAGTAPVLFCEGMNARIASCVNDEGCRAVMPHLSLFALHALTCVGDQGPFLEELSSLRARLRSTGGSVARSCPSLDELSACVTGSVPEGITCGAGWILPALMLHAASRSVLDVAYLSTFGCLSGHVVGKGALNVVRAKAPGINIASLEFDQGTSVVNQINRLKLLASTARQRTCESPSPLVKR